MRRGMATEMGIMDFSTAVQWKALAMEALQGPQVTALGRLKQRKWLWAGGLVLGGFQVMLSQDCGALCIPWCERLQVMPLSCLQQRLWLWAGWLVL